MTLFDILKGDHDSIIQMVRRLELDSSDTRISAETHKELMARLRGELTAHMYAEEAVVYPALHDLRLLRDAVDHLQDEQTTIDAILESLSQRRSTDENLAAKLHRLHSLLNAHFTEEESEVFPQAENLLSEADDRRLAREYLEKKNQILNSATHPLRQKPVNARMRQNTRTHH